MSNKSSIQLAILCILAFLAFGFFFGMIVSTTYGAADSAPVTYEGRLPRSATPTPTRDPGVVATRSPYWSCPATPYAPPGIVDVTPVPVPFCLTPYEFVRRHP